MKKSAISLFILGLTLTAQPAFAHDASKHTGPHYEGEVVTRDGGTFRIKTEKGEETVQLDKGTKFEVGEDGATADEKSFKAGDHVMVSGHKLESGVIVASEVMIHPHSDHDSHSTHDAK